MAGLKEFVAYLNNRLEVLGAVEKQLCELQEKYEAYFGEISRVRESEFRQLQGHVQEDRKKLPKWFNERVDKAQKKVEREYDAEVIALREKHAKLTSEAEQQRRSSSQAEKDAHGRNQWLDQQEEALKARNEQLLAAIQRFNEEIRSLGGGFGFFANFFRLRRLAKQKAALDQEQADVAARIEALRVQWDKEEKGYAKQESAFRSRWLELETEAAAFQTKLDYLTSARERIVMRTTLERVLYDLGKEMAAPNKDDPKCPRCKVANPPDSHFCHICAQRLTKDRPDFEGSIHEMAELNRHFQRFSDGMKACQEIIGLVRGLQSGVRAFRESVLDVQLSESKHSLPTLRINVPAKSVKYGQSFDGLAQSLTHDWSLHPKVMADRAKKLVDEVFTEERIKDYFETMGEELSRQADSQW